MSVEFLSFFLILFAGLFFSGIFNRLHLPWVAALIATGMILGPYGTGVLELNSAVEFIGEIGLVFLMFMAGLEAKLSSLKENWKNISIIAIITATLSFAVGILIGKYLGYGFETTFLLGVIFVSSSVAVIMPSLESNRLIDSKIGKTIIGTAILVDIFSLFLLSFVLQTTNPITILPLPVFYVLLFISLIVLKIIIPKIHNFLRHLSRKGGMFEGELRLVFAIMLGTVILFKILGLHSVVAGFFVGLILSENIKSDILKGKLHALSYGIFIPTFFVVVGANADLTTFLNGDGIIFLTSIIIVGVFLSKLAGGVIGTKMVGFSTKESVLVGIALTPKLSTALAASFAGFGVGVFSKDILTAAIFLSVFTTIITPIAVSLLSRNLIRDKNML